MHRVQSVLGDNPRPPRDSLPCDARARFNYKVSVGPVKGDQCGAFQVRQGLRFNGAFLQ